MPGGGDNENKEGGAKLSGKALKKARRAEKVNNRTNTSDSANQIPEQQANKTDEKELSSADSVKNSTKTLQRTDAGEHRETKASDVACQPDENETGVQKGTAQPTAAKPQLTKAERRAIQEAQRQAKALKKANDQEAKSDTPIAKTDAPAFNSANETKSQKVTFQETKLDSTGEDRPNKSIESSKSERQVSFFLHLPQPVESTTITKSMKFNQKEIHPDFVRLGVKSANGTLEGSNDHCVEFLKAVQELIDCYAGLDSSKTFSREFEAELKTNISFLESCRPLPMSTKNALKFLKSKISSLSIDQSNDCNLNLLKQDVNEYLSNKIQLSSDALVTEENWSSFVKNGDNILTFGYSTTAVNLLSNASKRLRERNEVFSVTIIDSSPCFAGRKTLRFLENLGVQCNYGLVTAISYLMPRVSKVLIGAHALLGNGAVMSSAGSGLVMLSAKSFNKPVIVCCETFKFSEKIQTDSIVSNELLNPLELVQNPTVGRVKSEQVKNLWEQDKLNVLNCAFDVTPPSLVTMVVSEVGSMPSLSVPIIYRWKCKDLQDYL